MVVGENKAMTPADLVTIGPDPLKLLGVLMLGAVGVTVGVAGVLLGLFGLPWFLASGWVVVALTGAVVVCCGGAVFLAAVVGNRPCVEISAGGFTTRTALTSRSRCWRDIESDFTVIKIGSAKAVGYRLTEAYKKLAGIKPTTMFAGNDEGISGAYRIPINELADLLNQHKGRARRET
jgi:hypothetical protein